MHLTVCGDKRRKVTWQLNKDNRQGEIDGDPLQDIPHPLPYLKEKFEKVASKIDSWQFLQC